MSGDNKIVYETAEVHVNLYYTLLLYIIFYYFIYYYLLLQASVIHQESKTDSRSY